MQKLTLDQPSSLVEAVNELIRVFDRDDPVCAERYEEWVSTRSSERALPDAWTRQLTTEDADVGYFCVETALSLAFRTVVASEMDDATPSTFRELHDWQVHSSERYYSELSKSVYTWPFRVFESGIEVSVPSTLFEIDSVGIEEKHDALGEIYHDVFDERLRKELGEFYTSERIIDYLLDNTGYDEDHWNQRLMDPACGSGSFLVSAVQRLLAAKPDNLSDAEAAYYICNYPRVVGFDISPFACEIARLRLFLTLYPYLDGDGNYKIQKLPVFNINSLARDRTDLGDDTNQTLARFTDGGDIREEYVDAVHLQRIAAPDYNRDEETTLNRLVSEYEDESNRPAGKTAHGRFDRVAGHVLRDNVKYDTVVGNPPYVRIQKVAKERRTEYKEGFKSATGRFDLSVLFVEYGVDALHCDGSIGVITSNKFLTTQYGEGLRSFLRENAAIDTLIDFTDTNVFGVTVLPCILVAQKGAETDSIGYSVLKQADAEGDSERCDDLLSLIDSHLTDDLFEGRYSVGLNGDTETMKLRCFRSRLPESEDATWTFIPEREDSLIEKIDRKKTDDLGSIARKISVGIKTTANDVFVDPITDSTIEQYGLEEELLYPAISGKNVSRWSIDWSAEDSKKPSYILYPHEVVDGSIKPVDLDEYPNAKEYLESHYEQLAGRSYLEDAGRDWYECWVPQHPDYFDVENKIVTPEMAPGNSFAIDTAGFFCIGSCYSILLTEESPVLYRYLLGLLNSDLVEFYLKADSSTQLYADRFRYNKSYIENLPVLYADPSEAEERSVDQYSVEDVVSVEEMMGYVAALVDQIRAPAETVESVENEINELVYRAFSISTEEREIIKRYLEFTSSD